MAIFACSTTAERCAASRRRSLAAFGASVLNLDESTLSANLEWTTQPGYYGVWGRSINELTNGNIEFDANALSPPPTPDLASEVQEVTQTSTPQIVWKMDLTSSTQNFYRAIACPVVSRGDLAILVAVGAPPGAPAPDLMGNLLPQRLLAIASRLSAERAFPAQVIAAKIFRNCFLRSGLSLPVSKATSIRPIPGTQFCLRSNAMKPAPSSLGSCVTTSYRRLNFFLGLLFLTTASLSAQSIFTGPRDYVVGSFPNSVVVGDFNGDGLPISLLPTRPVFQFSCKTATRLLANR